MTKPKLSLLTQKLPKPMDCQYCDDKTPSLTCSVLHDPQMFFVECQKCRARGPIDADPWQAAERWGSLTRRIT